MAMMTELESAYRANTYRIFLPTACCDLRIDQASELFRDWLEREAISQFAILTAHNPGAQLLDCETNMAQQSAMELELIEAGYEPYAGENVADAGDWPVEETCMIAGIGLAEATAAGAKYGQNAIVHGAADGVPHLVWINGK